MKTNQFTPLIRVKTSETATIDTLITQGITLFGRHHKCETSHTSPPIPVQCSRCFNRPICPTCPNQHPQINAPLNIPNAPSVEETQPGPSSAQNPMSS
jgi:hypothetical protein